MRGSKIIHSFGIHWGRRIFIVVFHMSTLERGLEAKSIAPKGGSHSSMALFDDLSPRYKRWREIQKTYNGRVDQESNY